MREHAIDAVMHLAAESHVDRSILGPEVFVQTNVLGTQRLLEASRQQGVKRFLMVSTDEVYGSLGPTGAFTETSPLQPSSPYPASKTSADLLALAWHHTFGLDVVVTRCSNNYVWNTCGAEVLSRVEFGRAVCAVFGFDAGLLVPVKLGEALARFHEDWKKR